MMRVLARRLRRDEGGFTLIEILVAATLAAVGIMALFTGFDSSRSMVTMAERNETASHQAQQELERLLAMDYAGLALTAAPTPSTDDEAPGRYVDGEGNYQWDQGKTGPRWEELVVDPVNGQVEPVRTWSDDRLSGEIHVFTTNVYDDKLVQTPTDEPDARRITVAVTVNGEGGPDKPVLMSSIAFDRGPTP